MSAIGIWPRTGPVDFQVSNRRSMKKLAVYWRNTPDDLAIIDNVVHVRFGVDEEEVITTNEGSDEITRLSRVPESPIVVDAASDIDPSDAATQISNWLSGEQKDEALEKLTTMQASEASR